MTTEQMETMADQQAEERERNERLFPSAATLRKERFDLGAWLVGHRSEIERQLREEGKARVSGFHNDDERKVVRQFFISLGYVVVAGWNKDAEDDGTSLIICL